MAGQGENATATFTINVQSHGREDLEAMRKSITGARSNLAEMNAALRALKGGGEQTRDSVARLKEQIAAQRSQLAGATKGYLDAGGKILDVGKKQDGWTDALKKASPQLEGLIGKVSKIPPGTALLAAGAVGATAAIVALTAATVAAGAGLVGYALSQADARRSELLRLEGLTKIRNFWTGFSAPVGNAAATASALQQAVDDVSGTVALGRGEVAGYAEDLYRMGLRGNALRDTLEGMATTAAVQGDAQARAFAGMAAGANLTGQSVRRLADDVKARLGGIAHAQTLSLANQMAKLRENVAGLFRDIKIDALLEAINGVTRLFSASSAAGKAMRDLLTAAVQPIINIFANNGGVVRDFFLGAATGALKMIGVVLDGALWVKRWVREVGLFKNASLDAFGTGAAMAKALGIGLLILAAPLISGTLAIAEFGFVFIKLFRLITETDWSALGKAVVDGIVGGLKRGVTAVVDAVTGLGRSAWQAFQRATDSHSPSRLFFGGGLNLAAGSALGVRVGAPMLERETARMGAASFAAFEVPPVAPPAGVGTPRGGSGAAATITIGDIHIHAATGDTGEKLARDFAAQLGIELDRLRRAEAA